MTQGRPRKIGADKAATLATGARLTGVTRSSARTILALLLRCTDSTGSEVARRHAWISEETGLNEATIRRAIHALMAADCLAVTPGTGHSVTRYRVNLDHLQTLTGTPTTVQELEPSTKNAHPGQAKRPPRAGETPTQGRRNAHPGQAKRLPQTRAGARAGASLLDSYLKDPLVPQRSPAPDALPVTSPAASGRAPFQSKEKPRCPRHTGAPGLNCRACGTTARQSAIRQTLRARMADLDTQRAASTARRAQDAAERAAATDPPADLRANLRAARTDRR